ncbi:hypothetical protein PILCRDRAFT_4798 [Piloderma croceum F 1598]|uniref:Uncharacterized protein n=1 Tax=Piloderma croceum (strain F 1598) TaxID=765440 RepID=A0A0C3G350_PILCF|nr:hypothetical protein PILCRDRAFT_4798 [Piloderma croceum F 1598]
MRILQSLNEDLLIELDQRYQEIPSFGRDTICRFSANSSEMKKMTAHDFENLLQCSIVIFEGLLPEPHNQAVMKLLFTMAHWHALAKLCMHNDLSLDVMDTVTVSLGKALRTFRDTTCSVFHTKELR